jgi:hypothetical protein
LKKSGKSTELCFLAAQLHPLGIPIVFAMAHGLVLASSTTPASGFQLRALGRVLIEGDLPGMHMGLQELFGVAI